MKIITIPPEQSFLIDLLKQAQENGAILQTTEGQQFVLLSLADWQGFDVGEANDFEQEVKATSENKALMALLANRRNDQKRIPLADVKEQLGLI